MRRSVPPDDFGELLDVQFEMIALAWQTNRTRVASMKMVEEASMRTYPNLGVHEAFHPTSHWGGFPERVANLRLIQNYHTAVFAKFAKRLKEMPEGDGSMLDHSIILFGSNMANSDAHNNDPLPQALIGRGGGIKGGQHLHYPQDTPHANILVTMLDRAGVPAEDFEKFADNTGALLGGVIDDALFDRRLVCLDWLALCVGLARPRRCVSAWRCAGTRSRRQHRQARRRVDPSRGPRTSTVAMPMAARRCSGRSTTVTSPRSSACCKAGADVSLANNYGATPMSLAAEVGNAEMLKLLLEAGAMPTRPIPTDRPRCWRWREPAMWRPHSCC